MKSKMNLKHKKFADEYVSNGFNGKQAYLKVYPKVADSTAAVNASKLLNDTNVEEYILNIQQKLNEKSLITKEEIILDLIEIKNQYKKEGRYAHNSIKALESLSKLLGLNEPDKVDIKADVNMSLKDMLGFDE